jgi:NAD(P)-dependent dehydrogenase (short-subunit alcohol dehydrogenase family)
MMTDKSRKPHALIIGASRGLGLALVAEYLKRGWQVTASQRGTTPTGLQALTETHPGRLEIEIIDITKPEQIDALAQRLSSHRFDLLFVNAGVAIDPGITMGDASDQDFIHVMVTNCLSPMRVIERMGDLVLPDGTIAVMSSILGSVGANNVGTWEVYRGSKAALNTAMRSYAARHRQDRRSLIAMAPGWVRTDMGGPQAHLSIDESIPGVVATIAAQRGKPGLQFLDYQGQTVPW